MQGWASLHLFVVQCSLSQGRDLFLNVSKRLLNIRSQRAYLCDCTSQEHNDTIVLFGRRTAQLINRLNK